MSANYLERTTVQRLYPVRYWMFLAYVIGVPNFVKFDSTGLTHKQGLFNVSSLSSIALTLSVASLLFFITLLSRKRLLQARVNITLWLWLALLANMVISSLLQPASRLTPAKITDLPLSFYRMGEWILGFVLLLALYTREEEELRLDLVIRLISTVCWVSIAMVWIVLPFAPSLVYGVTDDTASAHARLGGSLIHPVHLSVLTGVAFFHALLFWRGPKRAIGCLLAAVTLALTYARSEQIVFLVVLFAYLVLFSGKTLLRYAGILGVVSAAGLAVAFRGKILDYMARGNGVRNIATLSERTMVWQASFRAIAKRPYIGYGFIAGAKNALRDQWNATNWIPPHSHNELIQALVSGGILAGILVLCIYSRVLWAAIRSARQGLKQTFLLIVLIQVSLMSLIMPLITVQFGRVSSLFLISFVGVVAAQRQTSRARAARLATPLPDPSYPWASEIQI